jgi:hypothetical protein
MSKFGLEGIVGFDCSSVLKIYGSSG